MLESTIPLMVSNINHYVCYLLSVCNHQIQIKNALVLVYSVLLDDENQSKESIRPLRTNTQENASTLERILTEQFGENGKHLGTTLQYSSKLEYFTYELLSRVWFCYVCHLQNTELLSKEKQEEQIQCLLYYYMYCLFILMILDVVHLVQNYNVIIQRGGTKEWWTWKSFLFEDLQLQDNIS